MLYEVMKSVRNFFPTNRKKSGKIVIESGTVTLEDVPDGKYILIEGSDLNDGVYQYPTYDLLDETFDGCITMLNPPREFIELVEDIEKYQQKNKDNVGPYSSESFGGYSYSRLTNSNGGVMGWQGVFRERLNTWRKL